MYNWIYENCVYTLHQISHMHLDFTTPKGLKKYRRARKGRQDKTKSCLYIFISRQESVIGVKELWTVVTWLTSLVKPTSSSSSMRSLQPPLAGRATGTGTVSVLCFARGSILPVWTEQQAWSRNELCTAIDCDNYQVVSLWLLRVHRHLLRSWSVLDFVKISETSHPSLMWSPCVLMFVLCLMFCSSVIVVLSVCACVVKIFGILLVSPWLSFKKSMYK